VDPLGGIEVFGQALADEVLDGLDVVVGRRVLAVAVRLDLLDEGGVVLVELLVDGPELLALCGVDLEWRLVQVGECEEVLDLDPGACSHERSLAGVGNERFRVARVPAVERRDGRERGAVCHTCGSDESTRKGVESRRDDESRYGPGTDRGRSDPETPR
jgi:hypothetical protein